QPGILTQYIPELKILNAQYFAVPKTLPTLQVMAWYNWPTPEVMNGYDYPIEPGKTPLPHQKIMANFSVLHRRMFNLSSMGTMKTVASLWAADHLMLQHPLGEFKALIVAPLSTLTHVWGSAIFKHFLGRRTFEILHGSAKQRSEGLNKNVDFYVIKYEGDGTCEHNRRKFDFTG